VIRICETPCQVRVWWRKTFDRQKEVLPLQMG
jgi:hypothetical protein